MDYPLCEAAQSVLARLAARSDFGYPLIDSYLAAFSEWAAREQHWSVNPALTAPVADVMQGLDHAVRCLTEPGDGVVVLTPAYPPFLVMLAHLGRLFREFPLLDTSEGWRIDFDAVADALATGAKAVLLCHPHNPTGWVWSSDELRSVSELADRHGAVVISDEVHAPLAAGGQAFVPYAANDGASTHCVTVTSVSKAWNVPGLKSAVLVCQDSTKQALDSMSTR
ncbi:aminotransferase class I/II-fold pyridoxal phosphate-dependent enzyme [Saccharopolyspora sp. NPDC002376]